MSDEEIRRLSREAGDGDVEAARELLARLERSREWSIDLGKLKLTAEGARSVKDDDWRKKKAEDRARYILSQVQTRCDLEARAGRDHAIIMSVGSADYRLPITSPAIDEGVSIDPKWLTGTVKIVHDALADKGLRPTIERWDGPGGGHGFNLVAHF